MRFSLLFHEEWPRPSHCLTILRIQIQTLCVGNCNIHSLGFQYHLAVGKGNEVRLIFTAVTFSKQLACINIDTRALWSRCSFEDSFSSFLLSNFSRLLQSLSGSNGIWNPTIFPKANMKPIPSSYSLKMDGLNI